MATYQQLTRSDPYFLNLAGELAHFVNFDERREILALLFETPFTPLIPNDDNRAMDGVAVRNSHGNFKKDPANMLEVLVGIALRMDFKISKNGINSTVLFWELVGNLGLIADGTGKHERSTSFVNKGILTRFNKRIYDPDGTGGLFPLPGTKKDQRSVELWYQMAEYIQRYHPIE